MAKKAKQKKNKEKIVELDTSIFDQVDDEGNTIIKPRVYPSIYAFYNPNVSNYLKVGFTAQGVKRRLKQWREKEGYENIEEKGKWSAKASEGVYFRDEAVHRYLQEPNRNHHRLGRNEWEKDFYFSDEYFRFQEQNAKDLINDIELAVNDIAESFNNPDSPYAYYKANDNTREGDNIIRDKDYKLRSNQQEVVNRFNQAVDEGRKNLLMYAVMRFGKTFTALECAEELIKRNNEPIFIVIISGYLDVGREWYKALKEHKDFANIETFYDTERDDDFTTEHILQLKQEGKSAAIFITLQNLNNYQSDDPNDPRQPAFDIPIDLLIVDETHFAARGDKYGRVLEDYDTDVDDERELEEKAKSLRRENTIVLHLSGTPYRILMGNEFKKEDIIASVNYVNILEEQEKYEEELNEAEINSDGKVKYEWDNPYYGFPEMIRFGFDLDDESINKLKSMDQDSVLNELFKTKSTTKDENGNYKKFLHPRAVENLFKAIDGSAYKDKNIFGFLNYSKIKEAGMCNHIVVVLPYRASCDALADLLETRKKSKNENFNNLSQYEVINIAGFDNPDYNDGENLSSIIKSRITNFAKVGTKTISLTVRKMLTGVTVPEWDTMIFLRSTSSAQEYDQATYRIQNRYITEMTDKDGNKICINNKPQTLLVDFDLNRLFSLQVRSAKIMNYVKGLEGDENLNETIKKAEKRSPIIYIKDNQLVRVEPTEIVNEVNKYRKGHSIMDEASLLPVDLDILKYGDGTLKEYIEKEFKLGSKQGLNIQNHSDHRTHLDEPETIDDDETGETDEEINEATDNQDNNNEEKTLEGQIRSCYAKILFLAFLVEEEGINTLKELYNAIEENENDKKICERIGMDFDIFELFYKYFYEDPNKGSLLELNDSIAYLNDLAHNDEPDKVITILNKFSKLGSAVVLTPQKVCEDMVSMIPDDGFKNLGPDNKIMDIASTAAEFCPALVRRMRDDLHMDWEIIKDSIITIPKNGLCYELAIKVYRELGLNEENVVSDKTAFDLINKD